MIFVIRSSVGKTTLQGIYWLIRTSDNSSVLNVITRLLQNSILQYIFYNIPELNLTNVTYVTILQLIKATWLNINEHTVKTNPTHALFVHTKLNSQPVSTIIWRNIPVINLLYVLNVTIRQLRRQILSEICWHTQVKGPLHVHIVPTGLGKSCPSTTKTYIFVENQHKFL